MKKYIIKITALICLLTMLNSCSPKVLRTKEISQKITQTPVINETDIKDIKSYKSFNKMFKKAFIIPGLFEGAIPQGICYDSYSGLFLISAYYDKGRLPSVIMAVDAETLELVSYHPLNNIDSTEFFGHAGGIAASKTHIYLTSSGICYVVSRKTLTVAENGSPISFESNFKLTTKGSFAAMHNGILWAGDFIESTEEERKKAERITTLENGETLYAYCEGYILKDGLPDSSKINTSADGYLPDYMLAIPEQIQGMGFTKSGNILFTSSYGRKNDSIIYIFEDPLVSERAGIVTIDSKEIDLLACGSEHLKEKIIAPPMIEGAAQGTDGIYILFESGAAKYRSHRGKHPTDFVYKADIE